MLKRAKSLGDILIVGLNSDSSVKKIKGRGRPILPEAERAEILSALEAVDYVLLFKEATPEKLINKTSYSDMTIFVQTKSVEKIDNCIFCVCTIVPQRFIKVKKKMIKLFHRLRHPLFGFDFICG